jgi:hypothetical protein
MIVKQFFDIFQISRHIKTTTMTMTSVPHGVTTLLNVLVDANACGEAGQA